MVILAAFFLTASPLRLVWGGACQEVYERDQPILDAGTWYPAQCRCIQLVKKAEDISENLSLEASFVSVALVIVHISHPCEIWGNH
ncbi:hypothetical protein Trydic_g23793 [Trypoxylus dichotomus]